jgi:hypothetical protein
MATKLQRLRHYAELLRRPDDRCVQPKGMRKGNVSASSEETEGNANKAHRILHTVILFQIYFILL